MKKPFKRTKVGKILTSTVSKSILSKIPFGIGSIASEVFNATDTPEGEMNREKLVHHLVKLGIYAVLLYLVFSGKIDFDQAEQAKEFLQN